MIVDAFAKGDTATLRPLLSDALYDEFSGAIRDRLAQGTTLETRVEEMKGAEVLDGRVEGRTAFVTVKSVTRTINATRDGPGPVRPDERRVARECVRPSRSRRAPM